MQFCNKHTGHDVFALTAEHLLPDDRLVQASHVQQVGSEQILGNVHA